MSEQTGAFRNAAFGGFHRQDVLDYLEKLTRNHQTEKKELETALEDARASLASAEERLAEMEKAESRSADLRSDLEAQMADLQEKLASKAAALEEAEATIESLRVRVKELEPEAESWKRIKNTAGEIEVAAHERAQITIQDAADQAAHIQAEGVRWVMKIQDRCDELQKEIKASIVSAETELDQARDSFVRAETELDGYRKALSSLTNDVSESSN